MQYVRVNQFCFHGAVSFGWIGSKGRLTVGDSEVDITDLLFLYPPTCGRVEVEVCDDEDPHNDGSGLELPFTDLRRLPDTATIPERFSVRR